MWLVAAETPAQDSQTAIILGVIGLLTAVLVAVAGGVFSILSARANRTSPSPPSPSAAATDHLIYERVAVLERRADDGDERDDIQDRRLDQVERVLDLDNPDWRHRDR